MEGDVSSFADGKFVEVEILNREKKFIIKL